MGEMGKKKGSLSDNLNHRSQDVQQESQKHSSADKQNQKTGSNQAPTKRRQTRDGDMRSKTSTTGSESLSRSHDTKNGEEESTALSLPQQSSPLDHLSHGNHSSDFNHKNKNLNESHDKNKQHSEAAENSSGKHENATSTKEILIDAARHDREATPLAMNANPKIVVGESDGEMSSGHSTPVAKPGYHNSCEIDSAMSPATSTSTLTMIGIHSPPECNGYDDHHDHHYYRHSPNLLPPTDAEMPIDYRDKYYPHPKQRNLQPPHDQKFKKRSSAEFQSLKELDETNSFRTPSDHQPYNFNASPNQLNAHELSQVESFSQSTLPRLGNSKKRTSLGDLYSAQDSPPSSPRHFLSQSVMDINEQDEYLSQMSERSNLSRMSSEPYLGPHGYNAIYDSKYPQHPQNCRYSSGSTYAHIVPHSGRQGNPTRNNRYIKNRERMPGRRHSGDNSHHSATADKSSSALSLSQPRRGYVVKKIHSM